MKLSVSDKVERGTFNSGLVVNREIKPLPEEIAAMCCVYPLLPKLLGPEVAARVEVVMVRFQQGQLGQRLETLLTAILSDDKIPGWKLQVDWSPRSLETYRYFDEVSDEYPLKLREGPHAGPYPTQLVAERFALHIKEEILKSADALIANVENLKRAATN